MKLVPIIFCFCIALVSQSVQSSSPQVIQANAFWGKSFQNIGDINGDGHTDHIITSNDDSRHLYFGTASGPGVTPASPTSFDGISVGYIGDLNGDGYDDLETDKILGSSNPGQRGVAYFYYGSATGLVTNHYDTIIITPLSQSYSRSVSFSSAGDVDGDGYGDVVVGASAFEQTYEGEGAIFVFHGSASGIETTPRIQINGEQRVGFFGTSAWRIGDLNKDGYGDIIVGSPEYDNTAPNEGIASVYYGSANGIKENSVTVLDVNVRRSYFGSGAVSLGDVNGDGYADIVVGASAEQVFGTRGVEYIFYSSASGVSTSFSTSFIANQENTQVDIAAAGDINHDGFDDVMTDYRGVYSGNPNQNDGYFYLGSANGIVKDTAYRIQINRDNAYLSKSTRRMGDLNGDGLEDYYDPATNFFYYAANSNNTITVNLTSSTSTIAEASGTVELSATLSDIAATDVTVNLGYSGSATSGVDYIAPPSTITITAGQLTGSVNITAIKDNDVEPSETIIVDITGVTGATVGEVKSKQLTIIDDDKIGLSLTTDSTEFFEAGGVITLTAQLTQADSKDLRVYYDLSGKASRNIDYSVSPLIFVIEAGKLSGSIVITSRQDNLVESDETIVVKLTSVEGGNTELRGQVEQTLTMIDDDQTSVTLTTDATTVTEGSDSVSLIASIDNLSDSDISVSLGYSGTAQKDKDYFVVQEPLVIKAGEYSATTQIVAFDDDVVESNKSIVVDIVDISGLKAFENGTQQQTLELVDNDVRSISLAASATTLSEAADTLTLTAQLYGVSDEDITVGLKYYGLASAGTDYFFGGSSSITIAAGQLSGSTTLTTIDDDIVEANEVIIVAVESVSGGGPLELGVQYQYVTINDNDSVSVSLNVHNGSMIEDGGFDTLSAVLDRPVAANVKVMLGYNGTATKGEDYDNAVDFITISSGETVQSFVLKARQDTTKEGEETIIVSIVGASGVQTTLGSVTEQQVTLIDDDDIGPSGYAVNIDTTKVNKLNQTDIAFTLLNGEPGTVCQYTFSDGENQSVTGSFDVTLVNQQASNIDVSSLEDGLLTLTVRLVDTQGNIGSPATATVKKSTKTAELTIVSPQHQEVVTEDKPPLTFMFDRIISAGGDNNQITVNNLLTDAVVASIAADSGSVVIKGSYVVVYLPQPLADSGQYYVTIGEGAFYDLDGNPFKGLRKNTDWQFRTANPDLVTGADFVIVEEDAQVVIDVLQNDVSYDSTLDPTSVTVVAPAINGTTVVNSSNGAITYHPNANFNGTERFRYQVMDLNGSLSLPETIEIRVNPVNDAPVANDDDAEVALNGSIVIDVIRNDHDIDGSNEIDQTSLQLTDEPKHGQVIISEGQIQYTPSADFKGSDSFAYKVSDYSGAVSNEANVRVKVLK